MISFWKRATSGRQRWVTGLSTVAVAATLSVTWMAAAAPTDRSETYRQLNLFGDVFERVRANYVDEIDVKDLIEAAINGMLTSLDPHSSYLNAESFQDMQVQTRGRVWRSRHRSDDGGGTDQGGLANRWHTCVQGRP